MLRRSFRRTARLLLLFACVTMPLGFVTGHAPWAHAASVTLAWDANTETEVAGYRLHFGTASGAYTGQIDVGLQTTYTLTGLADAAAYFFSATAYDSEGRQSPYSAEIRYLTPACTLSLSVSESPSIPAAGASGTFQVGASTPTCAWTATVSDSWIAITSGASGTGTGIVSFAVATYEGKYPRTGSVTIADTTYTITQSGTGVRIGEVAGDFDGDGKADLLWQNTASGALQVWTMNGPVRVDVEDLTPGTLGDTNWKIVGTGDFNGDGDPDIVWQHQAQGLLGVWFMHGTTLNSVAWVTPNQVVDTGWKIVGVADFNGDGHPDLVWHHEAGGYLGVWLMNGTTMTSAVWLTPNRLSDTAWRVVGVGDFNGDGKPDILWYHQAGGWLGAWLMDGTTMRTAVWLTPSSVGDTNWKVAGVADFNGDGKSDILWQHEPTGTLGAWFMNGTVLSGAAYLTPQAVSDIHWKIRGPK